MRFAQRPFNRLPIGLPTGLLFLLVGFATVVSAEGPGTAVDSENSNFGTITEETPSIPQYFSWINNTNEGSTEAQTITNLEFFKWLHDEYGMRLGIYAWDAGNIDSEKYYGNMQSEKFKQQYPNGWGDIAALAKSFSCRLGLWGGPDGFGDTPEAEQARIDLLVSLCRDYELQLFKFDAVCTQLREEKQASFAKAMTECRKYAPDLIVLNHRLNLGVAKPHATTFLWGGAETYIDVHMRNRTTAPHNRAGALSRGLPPDLKRLTEDHGVCISSCLDYWEDDLVLQAFNRCLILAPEIYGNPWLLRDDEFAKLSRIFNLHFRHREILVKGMELPERYGSNAVSRGDGSTRFITLRNLSWQPVTYDVSLDEEIGLTDKGDVEVRRYHPSERMLGTFDHGQSLPIEVPPFRSYLLMATTKPCSEIGVLGCDYEVVRDTTNQPVLVKLLGLPGTNATVSLHPGSRSFSKAYLGNEPANKILDGSQTIRFPGQPVSLPWHKQLAELTPVEVPADAEQLYEATCFQAENNALEVQSLHRSGPTSIPQVQNARDAFFDQELFWRRGIWDKYMFDGKLETFFSVLHYGNDKRIDQGALRIDLGKPETIDQLSFRALWPSSDPRQPPLEVSAEVSKDLTSWKPVTFKRTAVQEGNIKVADIQKNGGSSSLFDADVYTWELQSDRAQPFRYLRIFDAPQRVAEFAAWANNKQLDASDWHATNLFAPFDAARPVAAWQAAAEIEDNTAEGSYLCVALDGKHGINKAFAALRVDGEWIGASQRAPSFPCVAWEYPARSQASNDTHYFPVTDAMRGKKIEIVVLGLTGGETNIKPHAWITSYYPPRESITLRLEE
ncbi:discoidin domain-containing protein [Novipirellula aureliae]|nr:discoidin domain-containing protein [Novipirellula aureliae]